MKFSVDAHAIGRQLTGNEVYVRNLLSGFAALDAESEFITYLSVDERSPWVPARFATRRVSANPFVRLGFELSSNLRQDRPDLLHVQYTAPLRCPVPVVVSVHDVSFLEHPEFFPRSRALQLRWSVNRTVRSAAKILTLSDFSSAAIQPFASAPLWPTSSMMMFVSTRCGSVSRGSMACSPSEIRLARR